MANSSGAVITKNYRTARDYWRSYLWESFIRGRQASRQKWTVSRCRSVAYTHSVDSHFADAKHRPAIASSDAVGVNNATSQSLTDRLTREHRMTLDEARMILNVRPQDSIDIIAQVRLYAILFLTLLGCGAIPVIFECHHLYLRDPPYIALTSCRGIRTDKYPIQRFEHLVKANSPRPLTESGPPGRGTGSYTSHYLLSKVVRARERLQAEVQVAEEVSVSSPPPAGPPP